MKIGIFDSGIGGISIATEILNNSSNEVIYFADNAFFPYGSKKEDIIAQRAFYISTKLISLGCELIIVACNTASSVALDDLRSSFSIPIIGIEPPVKPAMKITSSGKVLLLATSVTTKGDRLFRLEKNYTKQNKLFSIPMEGLAEDIESGKIQEKIKISKLETTIREYIEDGVDTIILGCTHYYLIKKQLEKFLPSSINILDAVDGVCKRVEILTKNDNVDSITPNYFDCYVTGELTSFIESYKTILNYDYELPEILVMKG